jgi:hypothetical protein
MNRIRRHLSYANVVATLALVFAMSGAAVAAKHYLVESARQINPKVIKKLRGNTGLRGAPGASGPRGEPGPQGSQGLSALSTLPSGQSESGDYGAVAQAKNYFDAMVSFPVPLSASIPLANVIYGDVGTPTTHCSGPGHAAPGYLCIYSTSHSNVTVPPEVTSFEGSEAKGAGRYGFLLQWLASTLNESFDVGTYTVTAP